MSSNHTPMGEIDADRFTNGKSKRGASGHPGRVNETNVPTRVVKLNILKSRLVKTCCNNQNQGLGSFKVSGVF